MSFIKLKVEIQSGQALLSLGLHSSTCVFSPEFLMVLVDNDRISLDRDIIYGDYSTI